MSFDPDKDDNYHILVDFFEVANIFELSTDIVNMTIRIRQKQKIKLPDAIIAVTAVINDFTLISRNTKDFKNISGLKVINPYDMH